MDGDAEPDRVLMTYVNGLGVLVFTLVVLFHFVSATPKDAEA